MTIGSVLAFAISAAGVSSADMLFVVAGMCLVSAWLARHLHRACHDVSVEPA
jgi:hypothetical protein